MMPDVKLRKTACKQVYFRTCQQNGRDEYRVSSIEWSFGNMGIYQKSLFDDVKC
jgi:hypothetical protein